MFRRTSLRSFGLRSTFIEPLVALLALVLGAEVVPINGQESQSPNRAAESTKTEKGQPQQQPARTGFADNVPAFLRKPVKRPVKVAGE